MGKRGIQSYSRRTMLVIFTVMFLAGCSHGLVRQKIQKPSKTTSLPDISATEKTFPETRDLDHRVLTFLKDNHYAGATLGVAHGDRVVYTQGYGQTEEGAPMKPTTLQPISSLSKTITAVAVLKLVELGDLHLSDTVFGPDGILPSFQPASNGRGVDPRLYDITVEHLLHHTAGWVQTTPRLYDPMLNSVYLSRGHDVVDIAKEMGLDRDLTPSDVISYVIRQPLNRAPGIKYEYSNFGYCVLGRVIETISQEKYSTFVRAQVLKPLGMWRTRIGPHRLIEAGHNNHVPVVSFSEGNIPLTDGDDFNKNKKSYNLLDSSLGWWSTTYDLMRFVTGLTSGMVLNSDSLKLLTKHPNPPASEHRHTWHGLGVHVNTDQAWWQQGDSHDNEVMLFHQESQQLPKSRFSRKRKSEPWSWTVILSDNNRKNLQPVFGGMISSMTQWPSDNLLIEDCGEYLARGSWSNFTLMNSKIGENQFPLLVEAVSRLFYYPEWINAYNVNQKTYLAAVFQRQTNGNFTSHKLAHGVTSTELYNINLDNLIEGFFLNFVTSYNSFHYSGQVRYTATFSKTRSNNTYRIGGSLRESGASLNAQNYMPSIQSVASQDGVRYFTYSLNTTKVKSWTSYDNLTLEELQLHIRTNANMDRVLEYLDSYTHLGQVLFSAVFTPGKAVKWQVQTGVRHNELAQQSSMFRGLRFRPKIIVGYECSGHPCFVIMWKKH